MQDEIVIKLELNTSVDISKLRVCLFVDDKNDASIKVLQLLYFMKPAHL